MNQTMNTATLAPSMKLIDGLMLDMVSGGRRDDRSENGPDSTNTTTPPPSTP